jgi:hypothetical protein
MTKTLPPTPPAEVLTPATQEAQRLSTAMQAALGPIDTQEPSDITTQAMAGAYEMLNAYKVTIDKPQILLVVDRAADVQRMWVELAQHNNQPWLTIGVVKVSTGKPGRKDHYKTPVGVFANDGTNMGYRALGTKNSNGIRGIGAKGMRVWDFGWQTTEDWRSPGSLTAVRMEMHATDPTYLEPRLGHPDSEGCIRIPSKFNVFLDHNGLIDADLVTMMPDDVNLQYLLGGQFTPTTIAGDKVVVIDTSEPDATPSDSTEAQNIEAQFAAYENGSAIK